MWPFKRPRRISDESWTVLKGSRGCRPLFVRLNSALSAMVGHPDFVFQIGIAIPIRGVDPAGLPKGLEEQASLNALEDEIAARLAQQDAVFAATITGDGVREFVFYSTTVVEAGVIEGFVAERGYGAQVIVRSDPHWRIYKQLAGRGCAWLGLLR